MQISDIRTVQDIETLLKEFDEYAKRYKYITFYCRNLNNFYHNDTIQLGSLGGAIMQRLFRLSENKTVLIKSYSYIDKDAVIKSENSKFTISRFGKKINVKIISDRKNPIEDFIKDFIALANKNKKVKNFSDAVDVLVENFDDNQKPLADLLDKLKNKLMSQADDLFKQEGYASTQTGIDDIRNIFSELKNNMELLAQDGYGYIIKELLKALVSLADVTDYKKSLTKLNVLGSIPGMIENGLNIYEFITEKWFYAFAGPISNLLAREFGLLLGLINVSSLSNIIEFHSGLEGSNSSFIDFSGFEAFGSSTRANVDEYLAVCGNIQDILTLEETSKYGLNHKKSVYSFFDNESPHKELRDNFTYMHKNIGLNKGASLYDTIKNSVVSNGAHFVYIQHPFFNSLKFANLLRDKSSKSKDETDNSARYGGLAKNYLVISSAPFKSNAKLGEYIIEKALSYKISDENNRGGDDTKIQDPESITQIKDYSKYSIIVNPGEEDLYLLNLSPFVRIDKKIIDDYEDDIINEQNESEKMRYGDFNAYGYSRIYQKAEIAKENLSHIYSFFKNAKDMKEIIEKEKKLFELGLEHFENFFESINKKIDIKLIYTDENGRKQKIGTDEWAQMDEDSPVGSVDYSPSPHSAIDIFMMATTFYIIRQRYASVNISKAKENSIIKAIFGRNGESLAVGKYEFKVLNNNSFVKINGKEEKFYFFKKTKEELGDKNALCIEEITEGFEKNFVSEDENILEENFYSLFRRFQDENEQDFNDTMDAREQQLAGEYIKIKNLESSFFEEKYKYSVDFALMSILRDTLRELFPFAGFFTDKAYVDTLKCMVRTIFSDKNTRNFFMESIGELKVFTLFKDENFNPKIIQDPKKLQEALESVKNKAFAGVVAIKQNVYLQYEFQEELTRREGKDNIGNQERLEKNKYFGKEFKNQASYIKQDAIKGAYQRLVDSHIKSFLKNTSLNFLIDLIYTSEYEKQKHQYKNILYKYYTHKYDEPYAVKNISLTPMSKDTKEYLYYPMQIHSSFMNVDLKRTIIGGRLSSGGLDYHKFFYYDINDIYTKTNSGLSKNMPLNKLIAYLCLDELRTTYRDDQSFFNHLKNHDMPFEPKELMVAGAKRPLDISNSSFMDTAKRWAINSMYSVGTEEEVDVPIDKYNEAMEILQDFKDGNFNTDTTDKETITDNKARRLLKALDVIGANNIKGLYVGCKDNYAKGELDISKAVLPPRLVGRLATTIIMEDGLFLG